MTLEVNGSLLWAVIEGLELRREEIRAYISEVQRLLRTHGTGRAAPRGAPRTEQGNGRGVRGRRRTRPASQMGEAPARAESKRPAPVIAFEPVASRQTRAPAKRKKITARRTTHGKEQSTGAVHRFPISAKKVRPHKVRKMVLVPPVQKPSVSISDRKQATVSAARPTPETEAPISDGTDGARREGAAHS